MGILTDPASWSTSLVAGEITSELLSFMVTTTFCPSSQPKAEKKEEGIVSCLLLVMVEVVVIVRKLYIRKEKMSRQGNMMNIKTPSRGGGFMFFA